jgi:sarcosine oxidase
MRQRDRFEVIVIGLGAMGAATLWQLGLRGIKALGIDRFSSPHAQGSSHGETRITRCAVGEGTAYVPLAQASHRIWRALEAATSQELLVQCGNLVIGHEGGGGLHGGTRDFVQTTIESAISGHVPHEILGSAEIMRRFPAITGLRGERACFEPDGGYVHPERCIAAQLEQAQALGASILRESVESIHQDASGVTIETTSGLHHAAQVVVAAGSWTSALLGAPFDRLLSVKRQVLHWFAADSESFAPQRFPTFIWVHGPRPEQSFYGFPALAGSGAVKVATEQYAVDCDPDTIDRDVASAEQRAMFGDHLRGRFAGIGPVCLRSTVCMYTMTKGGRFIIDRHPRMDRVTVISACSGHGFKHSAGIGEAVAQQLAEGRSQVDLTPFSLDQAML